MSGAGGIPAVHGRDEVNSWQNGQRGSHQKRHSPRGVLVVSRVATQDRDGPNWVRRVAQSAGLKVMSQLDYDRLRPTGSPSAKTVIRWAGSPWTEICRTAGVYPGGLGPTPWSEEAKLDALRTASREIGAAAPPSPAPPPITRIAYSEWRAAKGDPSNWPSDDVFGVDGDEWLEWCRRAGVRGGWKRRRLRHHDEAILRAMNAARSSDRSVSRTEYTRYRAAHPEAGLPSPATVIARYKHWATAEAAAAELLANQNASTNRPAGSAPPGRRARPDVARSG